MHLYKGKFYARNDIKLLKMQLNKGKYNLWKKREY